eukprot:g6037.t1
MTEKRKKKFGTNGNEELVLVQSDMRKRKNGKQISLHKRNVEVQEFRSRNWKLASCPRGCAVGFMKGFGVGFGLKSGAAVLKAFVKAIRRLWRKRKRGNPRNLLYTFSTIAFSMMSLKRFVKFLLSLLDQDSLRFGLFLGTGIGGYRALRGILSEAYPSGTIVTNDSCYSHMVSNAAVAGFVSSLAMFIDNKRSAIPRRTTLSLYALVKAIEFVLHGGGDALSTSNPIVQYLYKFKHYDTFFFSLSCSEIMYSWFYARARLPPNYVRWISAMASIDERLVEALKRFRLGSLRYTKNPNNFFHNYCLDHGLDPQIADCTAWIPKSVVHPMDPTSSIAHVIRTWIRTFFRAFVLYGPVHTLPVLIFRPRQIIVSPGQLFKRVSSAAVQSSAFLATFVGIIWASICSCRNMLRQSLDETTGVVLGCALCGLSILIERKSRRSALALYVLPRALQSLWCKAQSHGFVRSVKHGEVGLLAIAMAIIMHTYEHHPKRVRPSVHRLAQWLFG